MKNLADTFFGRVLGKLADVVTRRPKLFVIPQIFLAVGCIVYTVCFLQFDTGRDNLVGSDKKYHQDFLKFKKEFSLKDDLVVVVESEDREKNRQFVERIGAKLKAETNLFANVIYTRDLKMLGRKALQFLPEDKLIELQQTLVDYTPFVRQFSGTTNLESFFAMVNTQFHSAKREENAQNDSLVKALPALERIVRSAQESLLRFGVPPSPGVSAFFGAGDEAQQQIYITFAKGQIYLVTAQTPAEELGAKTVARLRELVEETQREVPGLNVGVTGEPVLEIDEMTQSERDMTISTIVSFVLVFIIIIFGYGKISRRIKADACLIVGMSYSMAFTTLAVGHLNILTITFAPILIGIAIDFGVHLIARYEEELQRGNTPEAALRTAMIYTGQGIFTGAFTTAGAFLAMGFTDFKGIQEMGVISGGGLLICLVPMLTMLPAMLLHGRQNASNDGHAEKVDRRARIENIWLRRPVMVVVITLSLCGLAYTQFHKVYFDYNLLNMQSWGLPAVVFEEKLIRSAEKSVLFAAVVADSPQEAVMLEEKIKKLSTVAEVESISRFLAEDQTGKLARIGQIKQQIADIQFAQIDTNAVNVPELSRTLWSLQGYLGNAVEAVGTNDMALRNQIISFQNALVDLRKQMLSGKVEAAALKLGGFQCALLTDMQETFQAIRDQDDRDVLHAEDLPAALRNRFVGLTGKQMLQVYPKKDVWQRENQGEFVGQLRHTLDPKHINHPIITGTPVQLFEYTTLLKESYQTAAWYSLAAIVLLVLVHFRNTSSVILSLVPVAVGSIWLGGVMGLFHIPFNPANIMTLPLVIGIGVTNGIHILNRFAEERTPSILAKSTGKAVLVSGLTTVAGFGSLMLAKHQGIKSLGYVMATGVAMCMIAGLTFLPALLNLRTRRNRPERERPSADNARPATGSGGTEANSQVLPKQ